MFAKRRKNLINILKEGYSKISSGIILLFADFENQKFCFRQESSFYYLTGVTEPAAVLAIYFDLKGYEEVLYLPDYGEVREKWVSSLLTAGNKEHAKKIKVDKIKKLGKVQKGYLYSPTFTIEKYLNLILDLSQRLDDNSKVFTLLDETGLRYFYQDKIYKDLCKNFVAMQNNTINIDSIVDEMRVIKNKFEVDLIYNAIQITSLAQESVCSFIKDGCTENEIKAIIEAVYIKMGAINAFPSIVASGKNTTVLHYQGQDKILKDGELVLIDIGSEYKYYASDLTRTYPVSGKFTKRQKEVYEVVLQTQAYIHQIAKPGMFLNNKDEQEKSLHHLAVEFLRQNGFDKYFFHGIGHHLGLDVHDVGSLSVSLMSGNVFTIEPGIYIAQEDLGIRIEDDFLMTDEGAVCLSYQLPKTIEEIEALF